MPINELNLADTYGRGVSDRQSQDFNALRIDAARSQNEQSKAAMSEQQRLETVSFLSDLGKIGEAGMSRDPNWYAEALPHIQSEFQRRGLGTDTIPPAGASPEIIIEGFRNMQRISEIQAAGQPQPEINKGDLVSVDGDGGPVYATARDALGQRPAVGASGSAAKPPASIAEYQLAKSEGYKGTFEEWQNSRARGQVVEFEGAKYILNPVTKEYHRLSTAAGEDEAAASRKRAEAEAAAAAKADADRKALEEANRKTLAVWNAGRAGLISGLDGTETGPIAGRIPAVTSGQQVAEGAIAAVAPVLKQLFRSAGEGIFTDKDQQLLLDMVPKRTDHPEARKSKMEMIDAIIYAKLGGQTEKPADNFQSLWDAAKSGDVLTAPDGTKRRKP